MQCTDDVITNDLIRCQAILLKHKHGTGHTDPNGPFDRAGKELCWKPEKGLSAIGLSVSFTKQFALRCQHEPQLFGLDACPKERTEGELRGMATIPNSTAIFLFREPVERLVSYFNDRSSSGVHKGEGIDNYCWAHRQKYNTYPQMLATIRKHFPSERLVLADSAALKTESRLKVLMDEIEVKAKLLPRRNFTVVFSNQARRTDDKRHTQDVLSDTMKQRLHAYYYDSNVKFFAMIGKDLGWNDGVHR